MIKYWGGGFAGVMLLLLGFSQMTAPRASAAGVVGTGTPGSCTEAAFDAAWAGGGVVTFNCGGAATIILTSQKSLVADVTFEGAGLITLSGNNATRLFVVNGGVLLTLNNITLTAGSSAGSSDVRGGLIDGTGAQIVVNSSRLTSSTATDQGGAIYCYVGTGGTLEINNSVISGSSAARGGGIYNDGCVMTITDSLISDNIAVNDGGGLSNLNGQVVMHRTTVRDNRGSPGGGMHLSGSSVELTDVNVVGNTATGSGGGGIYHSGGTLFVTNATISANRATAAGGNGGGIYQNSDDNLTLTNVTLSNNSAAGFGGGLYHLARYAVLTNVTIGNNTALAGDAIYEDSPMTGGSPGVVQIKNTAIFGSANNCDGGIFDSLGHNVSQGTCAALDQPTDQPNVAAIQLGALASNGGTFAMHTILPQPGSPVIDAADPASCPALDQRGAARVGACDVGAVEFGALLVQQYVPLVVR